MSQLVDRVFAEVCLDERITDGVFRMEEEAHMDALRDYFVKRGIPKEAAIHVTNRMVEGKYPDRQAWRVEDGILVTWPSPQHKKKAMQENPGKYTDQDPNPPKPKEPEKREPVKREPPPKEEPEDEPEKDTGDKGVPSIFQGDKKLEVEPPRGGQKPETELPAPPAPTVPVAPKTPERVAAEKEVVKQILATDDNALVNPATPVHEAMKRELQELYKKADELGLKEAVKFLTPYVKP